MPRPIPDPLVDLIADRLRMFSHPLRIRIIDYLARHGETTVQALADGLDVGQQNASRHLGLLERGGVLSRRREGRLAWYRVSDAAAPSLLEDVGTQIMRQARELVDSQPVQR